MKFEMLGSGSSGNCGLLRTDRSCTLIDAGFSGKRLREMLGERGLTFEQLDAVFVTHEHCDHIQGLRTLRKCKGIEFFANKNTTFAIESKHNLGIDWNTFRTGEQVTLNDICALSFNVPHDAAEPVGYVFSTSEQAAQGGDVESVAWMTDLGYIPSNVASYVANVDLLIIEANYDSDLLERDSKRPRYIKDRIRSRYGHLQNEAAINFIRNTKENRWKKIIFAHVSADCNSEFCIRSLVDTIDGRKFEFEIAHP